MRTIKIGYKFKQRMFPRSDYFFDWEYEVVGFKSEDFGRFAVCECKFGDGHTKKVKISADLLKWGAISGEGEYIPV